MEFIRFGSSIPGSYWGCCACCIIQDFNQYPHEKASIQLVSGDGGGPLTRGKSFLFAGPTYEDIFWQRIRFGTFDTQDMPNHAFLAILTMEQIGGRKDDCGDPDCDLCRGESDTPGAAWLPILKKAGFEFIRTVGNSVYDGNSVCDGKPTGTENENYIFGLFRNIGTNAVIDPFTPPKAWLSLPNSAPEAWNRRSYANASIDEELHQEMRAAHRKIWDEIGPAKLLTEEEVIAAGAPVILAGLRSQFPQEPKANRERKKELNAKQGKSVAEPAAMPAPSPFE